MKTPSLSNRLRQLFLQWLQQNSTLLVILLPVLFVLTGYVLYPNLQILLQSFVQDGLFSLANYQQFFNLTHTANWQALGGSLYISLLTVVFSALVGVPLAFFFAFYDFPGKKLFASLAILPIVMPPLVGVLAFLFLAGESGILPRGLQALFSLPSVPFAITGVSAILVVHTYSMYVYFYLFSATFFSEMDSAVLEAARNLGAGPWMTLTKVIVPMMTPALAGAALLVFMTSMASFSAPFIFAGSFRVLSLEIFNTKLNGELELAITQAVILTTISVIFLILLRRYSEKRKYVGGGKGVRLRPKLVSRGWLRFVMGGVGIFGVTLLVLPHLIVILMSFVKNGTWTWQTLPPAYTLENYTNLFQDPRVIEPVVNSLNMAAMATVANLLFGIAAAYLLVRQQFFGKKMVEALIMLPWAVPGTVLAVALIVTFNKPSLLTGGQILVGTFWILPLAYFVRNLPLVFRSTYASLEQFEPALEESARNLGAGWWFAFRKVMLPLIAPGVLAGALLAFVLALGEFVSSILLYNYANRPISVEIVSQLRIFNLGSAAAYSVFLIVLIGFVVLVSNRYLGQRSGQAVV